MSIEIAAQAAIYSALNGAISCGVYDDAPGLPVGQPDSQFPYVIIGEDTSREWGADDILGGQATVTLHFWSRYEGWKEVKDLMAEAYALLNRQRITPPGYEWVDCLWEFSTTVNDGSKHRHGVQRYRLTFSKMET